MLFRIDHETRLTYSEAVSETVFEVRMAPLSDEDQTALGHRLSITPPAPVVPYRDSFGNRVELFNVATPYQELRVKATGYVRTHRRPGDVRLSDLAWGPPQEPPTEVLDFLQPSKLVDRSQALDAFLASLPPLTGTLADVVRLLQAAVRDRLRYQKQVTNASTKVSEALALGCGVCQDYTHLFLGACRGIGLPARYVSGYIHQPGEVETHAWCQVWGGPTGWVDVDPTHCLFVGNDHVAIAVGRDYDDVPPNRGVWKGRAEETIAVAVSVEPADRVPFEWQGWTESSPWTESTPPTHSPFAPRGGSSGHFSPRQYRQSGAGQRSSYLGNYRHQQGQQQQLGESRRSYTLSDRQQRGIPLQGERPFQLREAGPVPDHRP
jgi:transglutaminase-like putative cysteine protease